MALANGSSHNVGVLLGNGTGGFGEVATFAAGGSYPHPLGVAVGDFNGDGKADLVLANSGYMSPNVAVLIGSGTGTFSAPALYASGGTSPYAVTVADFNADGKADVAVANNGSQNVGVLLGDGTGGFGAAKTVASGGTYPYSVTSGDFDADGRIDLAVANHGSDKVSILRGSGTGTFAAAVTYDSGGDAPKSVTVGDFNGDTKLDVAVANSASSNVGVLLGTGSVLGPLAPVVTYAAGASLPRSVTTGDFDHDGHADLAIANEGSHNVSIRLGTGTGEFGPAAMFASGGTAPYSVAAGDFNADGKTDLAVVNYWSRNIGVLLGTGTGHFAAAVTYDSGGTNPWSLVVQDFNADGKLDLAVANSGASNVGVLLGTGAGTFNAVTTYSSGGSSPRSVAVGDFNLDGKLDLTVSNNASQNVGVLLGTGTGSFGAVATYATGGSWAYAVTVADLNADGKDDLAVADYAGDAISVLLGDGTGGFTDPVQHASGGEYPCALTAGDFNADGNIDLAVTNQSGANTGNVGLLFGDGTGGFAEPVRYSSGGNSPTGLTAGDFNTDGKLDLALVNPSSETVGLLFGGGTTGFTTSPTYSAGPTYARSVAVADFDGDGKFDLAATNTTADANVSVLLGNGTGGFAEALTYASGANYAVGVTVADFNGDGKADLAVANNVSMVNNGVGVLLGTGAGGFDAAVRYSTGGNNPSALTSGDLNADGVADLIVSNGTSHTIGVLLGTGAGGFDAAVAYSSGGMYPRRLAVGDFNADGISDLAVANSDTHDVGVLFGDGMGGFAPAVTYASGGASPESVTVGDFNADGHLDLAVTNTGSHDVGVLLGTGAGGFAAATAYASGGLYPNAAAVADFDLDGNADLAVANASSPNITILWGTGGGGFAAGAGFAAGGPAPNSVAVGDFNADGRNDLVTGVTIGVGVLLDSAEHRPGVQSLLAPHGTWFDVQTRGFGAGQLVEAGEDAADGLGRLEVAGQTLAPALRADFLQDGDRTVITGSSWVSGIRVHREITVPATGSEDFARTVDVFTNPMDQPITTTVRIVGNLGSNAATTVWKTSDGDTLVEPTDQWIGSDDADGSGTPAIIHYLYSPAGLAPTAVSLGGDRGDNVQWTYEITIPAGETLRLAHFTIVADTRAAAEAAAAALVTASGFGGQAAAFLTAGEQDSLANFAFGAPSDVTINADEFSAGDGNDIRLTRSGTQLLVTVDGVTALNTSANGLNSLTINGQTGNDTLTVDFSDGNPIPAGGLEFHGGDPMSGSPGDTLVLERGTSSGMFDTITHTLVNASDGSVRLDADGPGSMPASVITYTGLEPIGDNLDTADRIFSFTGGAETITLADVGGADGNTQLASTLGESITFGNPTRSLRIETTSGTGADAIYAQGLDAAFDADFIVAADADDTFRFQTNSSDVGTGHITITAGNIRLAATASTTGTARLEALSGSILRGPSEFQTDLAAATAVLIAAAGIGELAGIAPVELKPLQLAVGNVEAAGGTGAVLIYNDRPLTLGDVTETLSGISAGGHIDIFANGDLLVSEPVINTTGAGYTDLTGDTVTINANLLTSGSDSLIDSENGGDIVLNATIDSDGGIVQLLSSGSMRINGSILTQGAQAQLYAFRDVVFTDLGIIDAEVASVENDTVILVDALGALTMADGARIDARDCVLALTSVGDMTISSLTADWLVYLYTSTGSILDGGDSHPDIVSEVAQLMADAATGNAVGTPANPLDTQLDVVTGQSAAGFYVTNTGSLDVAEVGIDAGGDVQLTASGELTLSSSISSGGLGKLTATGSILANPAVSGPHLVAVAAILVAETGMALDLQVSSVEADGGSGAVSLENAGALTVGGVTGDLNGIVGGDDITIIAVGDLTVSEPVTDTVGAGYMALEGYTVLINADVLTRGSVVEIWSFNDGGAPDDGDMILNSIIDSDGGFVYLYCENNLTLNSSLLTGGADAELFAFGNIAFTPTGRVDAEVSPETGWPLFEVSASGSIAMADGSFINARDGELHLLADGNVLLSSLVADWYVSVFSRDGSILDSGDSNPDIVAQTAQLTAYLAGAVGSAADPLDTQLNELNGDSVGGFYFENAGGLAIVYTGVNAGGDVQVTANGDLTVSAPVNSGGSVTLTSTGAIITTASIATTGDAVTILAPAGTITVDAPVTTTPGTGGEIILIGSVLVNGILTPGAGTITLHAKTPTVTVDALVTSDTTPTITGTLSDGTLTVAVNGKTYTAGDGNLTVDGTGWVLQIPVPDVLDVGTYDVVAAATDATGNVFWDTTAGELLIEGPDNLLRVLSITPTAAGFVAQLNRPFEEGALNLYHGQGGTWGASDLQLRDGDGQATVGSLVVDPSLQQATFLKTDGLLAAGTYTVTLKSGTGAFHDKATDLALDGDGDGTAGGDFTATFSVVAPPDGTVAVSLSNFARGPGQAVDVPGSLTAGIPLRLSDGENVESVSFVLRYNPALLNISGATVDPSMLSTSSVTVDFQSPGVLRLDFTSLTPLAAGAATLLNLQASVPAMAAYTAKAILDLEDVSINEGTIPAVDDDGLHVVAYFGDVTGNGTYSSLDTSWVSRVVVGLDSGFSSYRLSDPIIVGDITGNGSITSLDTSRISRVVVGLPVSEVPPLPSPALPVVSTGPDPLLSIPRDLSAGRGEGLTVPVHIDSIVDLTATPLYAADLVLQFDPQVMTASSVSWGEVPMASPEAHWSAPVVNIDNTSGQIIIGLWNQVGLRGVFAGSLVQVQFAVDSAAPLGDTAINLAATASDRFTLLNEGNLTLIPAPTNSADDDVDGRVTVQGLDWQNPTNAFDVNNDGSVSALDVLMLINYINAHAGSATLPLHPAAPPYYDVNVDLQCTAQDVLLVINHLNARPLPTPEGEADRQGAAANRLVPIAVWSTVAVSPAEAPSATRGGGRDAAARDAVIELDLHLTDLDDLLSALATDVAGQ